jgi:hypothetical protein
MASGGDIKEITCNHPTLGTSVFAVKSAEDSEYDLGGFKSSDDENQTAGNGEMIDQMNNTRWSFSAPVVWDMNNRDDLAVLKKLMGSPVLGDWTITHINGVVHGGKGKPVGELKGNGNAATIDLKVSGSGELRKIVG